MTMAENIPRVWQRVGFFILLTYAISAPFEYLAIAGGGMGAAGGLYALGGMWSPGIAAFITLAVFRKEIGPFGWRWGKTRYQVWSVLIPLFYSLVGYGLVWLLGFGDLLTDKAGDRLPILARNVAITCVATLGEEIGWSGFLVPQVARAHGYTTAALTRGVAWSVWHYPMIIAGIYGNDSPLWYNLVCFTIILTGTSFIYAWLRLRSGSLWTGTLLHASHNASIQSYFTPITGATALTAYFIDEFGAALAVVAVVLAFVFWRMRGRLPEAAAPPFPSR